MPNELEALSVQERVKTALALQESHFREFKSALEGPPGEKKSRDPKSVKRDIGETLVAFANADGGELLVGVEDDGVVTGVAYSEQVVESLLASWKSHVHPKTPLAKPRAVRIEIDGHRVLYFAIEKGTQFVHLTQDGRCLQRKDRESVPVSSEEIAFERKERISREYDRTFLDGADATALRLETVEAVGSEVAPGLSAEKVLQLLGLAEFSESGIRIRRAAALLFAKDVLHWHPRCEVRLLRVAGTELRTGRDYNVVADKHVVGNILELLVSAWEEIRPYLVETRLGPDGRFQEQVRYPEDACREALTNALAHRDYTVEGRAVEVYVFDDRLEIRSPGPLLSTVTIENLRALKGVHQSRNTAVARTLRELGYMREMGEGFRRMFQLMRAHDLLEPEIVSDEEMFTVSLRYRSVFSEEDQRWISAFEPFNLERDEEKVLLLGRTGKTLSVQQIMDAVDLVDTEDYRALIERLQTKGLIRGIRRSKATGKKTRNSPRWTVLQPKEALAVQAELLAYTRNAYTNDAFAPVQFGEILKQLPPTSPYARGPRNLARAFQAFGWTDGEGNPTPHFHSQLGGAPAMGPVDGSSWPSRGSDTHGGEAYQPMDPEDLQIAGQVAGRRTSNTLFVGGIGYDIGPEDLRPVFAEFGAIARISVPRNPRTPQRNRGYAFVEFAESEAAKTARSSAEGYVVRGRPIHLDWAR